MQDPLRCISNNGRSKNQCQGGRELTLGYNVISEYEMFLHDKR
jgi:hypothetical protein